MDEDDFFADDIDLDDIPAAAIQELEERARYLSTQPVQIIASNGLDTHQSPSSDYEFDEEDVVDLDAQESYAASRFPKTSAKPSKPAHDHAALQESWRQQRCGQSSVRPQKGWIRPVQEIKRPTPRSSPRPPVPTQSYQNNPVEALPPPTRQVHHEIDATALQARIFELEQERIVLQQAAEQAKSAALSRAGEIAIVRANHGKITREYERRIDEAQRLHLEEIARQKAEIEATRKDREKVETDNRFLQHDLAERSRNRRKTLKDKQNPRRDSVQPSPITTPQKDKAFSFRDGFDDVEVVTISPSKVRVTSRPLTPKAGVKRKRAMTNQRLSPGLALSFSDLGGAPQVESPTTPVQAASKFLAPDQLDYEVKFKLLQLLLNHRPQPERPRTFEALSNCCLPTLAPASLSTTILDFLSLLPPKQGADEFRRDLCYIILTLWSSCMEEKYYDPLYELTELLQYILLLSPTTLSKLLLTRLVPLCVATADLVALPIAKASMSRTPNEGPSATLKTNIDPLDYLYILHLLVLNCYPVKDMLTAFWTAMEFDFVLLLLHKAQPLCQISQMLDLLQTSILPASFGAVSDDDSPPAQQGKNESSIIDRLTTLLFETPEPPTDEDAYSVLELAELRTSVINLLYTLALTRHGGTLLSTHRIFISRCVRFLHDTILAMYAYHPATHVLTTRAVNTTVLLLGHLTSEHSDAVGDIRVKLAAVPGGAHKHLVSLSRVAFAEGWSMLEGGVDGEAAEQAHRMLDELLSPEEGEAVVGVFSSAKA